MRRTESSGAVGWLLAASLAAGAPDFSAAVRAVRPALVSIITDRVALRSGVDTTAEPQLAPSRNLGSGFVLDRQGHVLTCNHVVAGYEELTLEFADGSRYSGAAVEVVGRDPVTDLAVVKVRAERDFEALQLGDSDSLRVGQWVLAMGNPFGLENSASAGIVSGLSRWGLAKSSGPDFQDFIQTDALVNPGNSGGPLVDTAGRVIGVCSFTKTSRQTDFTGIGFATPINLALSVAGQLIRHGKVIRGYMGLATQPMTDRLRQALGLESCEGALVVSVAPGGPATAAGVLPGDVILTLNGVRVDDVRTFQGDVAVLAPGSTVQLEVIRRQQRLAKTVTLAAWPVAGTGAQPAPPARNWLGLELRELSPTERNRSPAAAGVMVVAVEPAAPAEEAGIRPGDVIIEVNFAPTASLRAFGAAARQAGGYAKPLLFRMLRRGTPFYVAV
ncbi:PDZ domain-containing protein, partial [candidate division WOR-3 bacterium]|nr:PDZ domain-containing protein [candidate division WOR-3 bacterium]